MEEIFRHGNLRLYICRGEQGYHGLLLVEQREGITIPRAYRFDSDAEKIQDQIMEVLDIMRATLKPGAVRRILALTHIKTDHGILSGSFGLDIVCDLATMMKNTIVRPRPAEILRLVNKDFFRPNELRARIDAEKV